MSEPGLDTLGPALGSALGSLATLPPPTRYQSAGVSPAVWGPAPTDAPEVKTADVLWGPLSHAWGVLQTEWRTQPRPAPADNIPRPTMRLSACWRSGPEQDRLYAQGRTTPGKIVTKAKAGQSLHTQWPARAFDVAFLDAAGDYVWQYQWYARLWGMAKELVRAGRIWPLAWGGQWNSFADYPHFESAADRWENPVPPPYRAAWDAFTHATGAGPAAPPGVPSPLRAA